MKFSVEQIVPEQEEAVTVKCHNISSEWVENIREAAFGQRTVCGYKSGDLYRIKLTDIYYFEIVDNNSFLYTKNDLYESREKLYEFEKLCVRSSLFRCGKSMIVNADKIDYIRPSFSGRFEAVLSNGEKIIVSRKYVSELKKQFGIREGL